MSNNRRFTFKFLGVLMEAINITPKEIRKTMWSAAMILFIVVVLWRLPDLITALGSVAK